MAGKGSCEGGKDGLQVDDMGHSAGLADSQAKIQGGVLPITETLGRGDMKIGNPWDRGSMTFTNKWAKPSGMKMDDWLKSPKGRTWVSKCGELPSEFLFRILKDMEDQGAAITDALFEALKNDRK